jgi:hypothetical protein
MNISRRAQLISSSERQRYEPAEVFAVVAQVLALLPKGNLELVAPYVAMLTALTG